jgi:radical SAM-linked protein
LSRHDKSQDMTRATKLRLRFAKRGDLRLISHHDLMRCLERMMRRAQIPLAQSQGFTPRPKIVFAQALAVGIEGLNEIVDIELFEPSVTSDVLRRLAAAAPAGFDWLGVERLPAGAQSPRPVALNYELTVPAQRRAGAAARLGCLLSSTRWPLVRRRPDRDREQTIDLRPFLLDAELTGEGVLRARLAVFPNGSARPEELLECLGLSDLLRQGAVLVRTGVELADHDRPVLSAQGNGAEIAPGDRG